MAITRQTAVADLPELLRVEEVAQWLDIGRGTAYELVRTGALPCVRLGRLVRVPRLALAGMAREVTGG